MLFVGSAPLPHDCSDFISSCDCVVRFNNCKNYGGHTGIKTDILIINNAGNPDTLPTLRFMLTPRTDEESVQEAPFLEQAGEIRFARPPTDFIVEFIKMNVPDGRLKEIELAQLRPGRDLAAEIVRSQQIPAEKLRPLPAPEFYSGVWKKLLAIGSTDAVVPSTGIMGVEMLLADPRFKDYQKLITGFNWGIWNGHPRRLEKKLIEDYTQRGILQDLSRSRVLFTRWEKAPFYKKPGRVLFELLWVIFKDWLKKLKPVIKRIPFLHRKLLPLINRFREPRHIKEKSNPEREMWHFKKLCQRLPHVVPNPFFVKVGANDGITGDPTSRLFLSTPQWRGLLIEPVPYCFEKLKENFGDTSRFALEQVAVGANAEKRPFYYVSENARDHLPDLPDWFDQLGSFDRAHITKHLDGMLEPFIMERIVEVLPLKKLLDRNNVEKIHLLHLDTEGHDFEILKTLDLKTLSPVLILIEHRHLSKHDKAALCRLLRQNGYSVSNAGLDYLANCRKLIGSHWSSFSHTAAEINGIERVILDDSATANPSRATPEVGADNFASPPHAMQKPADRVGRPQ